MLSPTFVGFFVYRHLGLLGCNIVLMKCFLPLFMLTGLLSGQDTTIVLENGSTVSGTIISETDSTYRIMGESWRVTDGVYEAFNTFINISKNETEGEAAQKAKEYFGPNMLPKNIVSKQEILNMSDEEKGLLYGKYKISPFGNTAISFFVPTLGYHRINQWKQRGLSCCGLYFGCAVAIILEVGLFNLINAPKDPNTNILDSITGSFMALHLFDVYTQTKKYNRNLSMSIFGQKTPPPTLAIFPLKTNYKHYFNFFGVPNHRTGIGMFGYSITKRTKKNNEYYMGIGTAIINLSITAGWKYYFKKSNADDYYLAMSLVGSTLEIDDRYDETKKVSKDFIAGNFSAGYEKRLSKNIYLNMEIFTLIGKIPHNERITDGIRLLVAPSFHFNYRI